MCDNDLDTILSYLSSKINKIFCDREFVGCVKEDFDIILRNTDNHCVIFPKLKPIFLKVLRHQAVIFDLSVFCIGSGPNQLAVVCKKEFLNEQSDEYPVEESKQESKAMDGEENVDKAHLKKANRINRPTQPFYVPPAQRSTTRKKINHENKTTNKTRIKFKSKHKAAEKLLIEKKEEEADASNMPLTKTMVNDDLENELITSHNLCSEYVKSTSQLPNNTEHGECEAYLDDAQLPNSGKEEDSGACLNVAQFSYIREQETSEEHGLDDIQLPTSTEEKDENGTYLDVAQLPYSRDEEENAASLNVDQSPSSKKQEGEDCLDIEERLCSLLNTSDINELPQEQQQQTQNNISNELVQNKNSEDNSTTIDNKSALTETDDYVGHSVKPQEIQINAEISELPTKDQNVQNNIGENSDESIKINGVYTLPALIMQQCTKHPKLHTLIENLRRQQHADESSSNENDKLIKYLETILMEENYSETEKASYLNEEIQKLLAYFDSSSDNCMDKHSDFDLRGSFSLSNNVGDGNSNTDSVHIIEPPIENQTDFSDVDDIVESKQQLYISYNDISKKKTTDCDMDNENEEMQRVIENINRKSRSLIKHNIRNVNTLRIDENERVPQHNANVYDNNKKSSINAAESNCIKEDPDNLSNWEDMFDETGDLQPEYIGKIVKRIGCDVKIVKASHDYSAYENTKYQDLEHVIELYDFPSTFKTQDLIQLYRGAYQDATMYVKWCDDTHALLVLSTPAQAQRALQIKHEVIQSRPLSQASSVAALTASSADLKPAMKRPQTNMQTARRMITTHLGTKSSLSKEEVEQERQALRDAREQRRQERQNEKDAWEGRPRSSK